jgi:flavin-dependent dehydrogenase
MWALSRHALDALLLGAALEAGSTLFQPYRCERIDPLSPNPRSEIRDLATNRVTSLESDYILLADGRRALHERPAVTTDLGIKAHFSGVFSPHDAIELFSLRGHYLGLAPVESGHWNVAYSVPAGRVRACHGNLDVLFKELSFENPTLAGAFAGAERVTDWLASPLPRFGIADNFPPGMIPIGNAAASIEPIGGEGMGLALRSAELAARALICGGGDRAHAEIKRLPSVYRNLWRARRPACRAGAVVLSHPRLSSAAIDLLNTIPAVATPSLYLVGK